MPDKRTDEQFMDQAWEQMQIVLDREMPEERKRRLVPIFWMLGAAASLLLLLTVGGILWQQKSLQMPVASVENRSNITSTLAQEDCEEATNNSTLAQQKTKSAAAIQNQDQLAIVKTKNANARILKNRKDKDVKPEAINNISIHYNKANLMAESLSPIFKDENIITQSVKSNNNQNITTVTPIHSLDLAMLEYQSITDLPKQQQKPAYWYPLDPNENDKKANIEQNDVKIGVEFATYASAYAAVDGYAGGAIMDIPVQSKNLNLRAGVNFSTQQRYFDSSVAVDAAKATGPSNPGFGATNVTVDPNPQLSVNAKQVSLPVTLQFKPRRTWGLEGGVQASYLVGAQNLKGAEAYQTLTGLTYGNQTIRTFVNKLALDSSNGGNNNSDKINLEQLRRFDVALTAGFGYYPTSSIGVRLQYQRGLIDMLKASDFKAFGNNIRLSAVYFFGK